MVERGGSIPSGMVSFNGKWMVCPDFDVWSTSEWVEVEFHRFGGGSYRIERKTFEECLKEAQRLGVIYEPPPGSRPKLTKFSIDRGVWIVSRPRGGLDGWTAHFVRYVGHVSFRGAERAARR